MATEKCKAMIGHYDQTMDVTFKLWHQRNRTFLNLMIFIVLAAILSDQRFVRAIVSAILDYTARDQHSDTLAILDAFPYEIVHGTLIVGVFYLMANLYHNSVSVSRLYSYLGKMEGDIRSEMNASVNEVVFTRESAFYWKKRPVMMSLIKFVYILIIGALLSLFFYLRFTTDYSAYVRSGMSDWRMLLIDLVVGVPIAVVFLGYAFEAVRWDKEEA